MLLSFNSLQQCWAGSNRLADVRSYIDFKRTVLLRSAQSRRAVRLQQVIRAEALLQDVLRATDCITQFW